MQILGESLEQLRATRTSVKWRAYPPDVVPVWVAEMDARPCPPVVAAVTDALQRGDTGYAWPGALAEAFAGFAKRRWDWSVDPATVSPLPDVMIGIEELLRALTPHDGAVVVSPPCYDAFYGFVEAVGHRLVEAPLGADHRLDPDTLDRAFADAGQGAAYLLCNPQNPTGTVHTAEELATVARLADRHGVVVLSDEIHAPLVMPGVTFTPYLTVPEAARGIAVVSGSKAWNLAGLKVALAVPGAEAGDRLGRLHEVVTHGVNHLAAIAQTAAYDAGEAWLDQLLTEIGDRRALLTDLLATHLPQVEVTPAEATYLAWLDCSALGLDDPAATFLERGRVAVAAGARYDRRATQWVRFNLGTSPEMITEAVRRMAVVV
ncbi:MalY/PatB family protein [Nocardioides sp.]|uniref:MalY/PatB family protein n=1 Tax=Nocardioides sp. TaxID=35761 RepID=UPI002733C4D9|nr:aminotransferase class I/II-fold pyridoxal phosphate-dependent enzyme [Nocardioides sp.]MDP3890041.1 aminotransferase class I/II-fold pyridoxal phosphate-dependent enzyme [Nocardioides sp.]